MDSRKVCEGVVRSTGKECIHIAKYDNYTRCGFHKDKKHSIIDVPKKRMKRNIRV